MLSTLIAVVLGTVVASDANAFTLTSAVGVEGGTLGLTGHGLCCTSYV